jgi:hypothetical protein
MIWLVSGASEHPVDNTGMEKHSAEALYSGAKSLMHAIWTKDEEAQQDVAPRMIQISKPSMIRQWSQLKLGNIEPLVRIPKQNAHLIDLVETEAKHVHQKTVVEKYNASGSSGT